jgi:hypothetical protein
MLRSWIEKLRRAHVIVLLASGVLAVAGAVHADWVDSGFVWRTDVGTPQCCRGMYLLSKIGYGAILDGKPIPRSEGTVQARVCSSNGVPQSLPAGWIGVAADTWRSGGFCGSSGWKYSTSQSHTVMTSHCCCNNPSGNQPFQAVAYQTYMGQASPIMNM